jgi:hypothetical protein
MKNVDFINELKIRASYGETGNNNIGDYEQFATINYEKYSLNEPLFQAMRHDHFLTQV